MANSQSNDRQYVMDGIQVTTSGGWMPAAPGVVEHSTHMHAAETSVNSGHAGSETAAGTEVTGAFKTFAQSTPQVWFTKPEHDSEFAGTCMFPGETSITSPGSSTARGFERGEKKA